MSTFGSTTEDIDGVPIDRGPPEEMRMTEAELRGAMQSVAKAKMTMGEISTVRGIQAEMEVLRDLVDNAMEQHNRMIGLLQTLQNEFSQYREQRAKELQSWVAKGGTNPEDA